MFPERSLTILAGALLLAGAAQTQAETPSATAARLSAECDARVKAGRMHFHSCYANCKGMSAALPAMPPAQAAVMLKMCTDAVAQSEAQETQSKAESDALVARNEQAERAAQAQPKPVPPPALPAANKPGPGGLLTYVGRETDYKFIDAIFAGQFKGVDPLSMRFTYMGYVTASSKNCKTNTPNGGRTIVMTSTLITKNRWGMEIGRTETEQHLHVDSRLYDRTWHNLNTTPPGVNILNAGVFDDVLSAASTDYVRLFNTWKCNGPEIRQMNENLHRIAEGLPSLQAEKGLPVPAYQPPPTPTGKSDDFGLLLRKPHHEYRQRRGEHWCGLRTARFELFYDRKDYDTAALVRSGSPSFVSDDLLPLINAQCPKAMLIEMWVYGYGSAELRETWTFRWAPNGDWIRRTSAGIPNSLQLRESVVYAPGK